MVDSLLHRFQSAWTLSAIVAGLLAGCLGQSGLEVEDGIRDPFEPEPSATVQLMPPCECELSTSGVLARGRYEGGDACEAEVRVTAVMAGQERADVSLGDWLAAPPAKPECFDADLAVGDDVLAVYAPPDVAHPRGRLIVRRYADELDIPGPDTVAPLTSAEYPLLVRGDQCLRRLTPPLSFDVPEGPFPVEEGPAGGPITPELLADGPVSEDPSSAARQGPFEGLADPEVLVDPEGLADPEGDGLSDDDPPVDDAPRCPPTAPGVTEEAAAPPEATVADPPPAASAGPGGVPGASASAGEPTAESPG